MDVATGVDGWLRTASLQVSTNRRRRKPSQMCMATIEFARCEIGVDAFMRTRS
jgi:hypothetical protein